MNKIDMKMSPPRKPPGYENHTLSMRISAANAKYTAGVLIRNGAVICAKTNRNYNALYFIADKNSTDVLSVLVEATDIQDFTKCINDSTQYD